MPNEPIDLRDGAAHTARLAKITRRTDAALQRTHVKVDERKAHPARVVLEEETASHEDVRDLPELEAWAGDLGFRHGYAGRPLCLSVFAQLMRREMRRDHPGLDPRYYESHYVGGHMRGENGAVAQAAYALDHGESRPPFAPFLDPKLR